MKNLVFIDTGAFLAKYLANDSEHKRALEIWKKLSSSQCITSNHILDETLTLLGRRAGYTFSADRGEAILNSEILTVHYSDRELEDRGIALRGKIDLLRC